MIGLRYLYGGKRDRLMMWLALGGLVVAGGGFGMLMAVGPSVIGVSLVIAGMLTATVCGLLTIFSVFTAVSVLGVALGVAALTIVLAVTTGFQESFRDKVLGVNAHVIVTQAIDLPYTGFDDVMKTAKDSDPDIIAQQPFTLAEMLATRGKGQLSGVLIKGIDPKRVRGVLDLDKHMTVGSIDDLSHHSANCLPDEHPCVELPPIILGKQLADKLKITKIGERVTIVVPLSNLDLKTMQASAPRTREFRVVGMFYSGFDEYDRRLMYAALDDMSDGSQFVAMGVEMKVKDIDRASEIANKLSKALDTGRYQVQDWRSLNDNLFTALKLQKVVLVIILTLIIVVAAVNMVSALTMMVTDKTREVAILKSMGATSGSVAQVFQVVGIAIGGAGTIAGVALGLALCYVTSRFGFKLDPSVYLIDRLPVDVQPFEVVLVAGITMLISIVATIVPASGASALRPVEGLRYD